MLIHLNDVNCMPILKHIILMTFHYIAVKQGIQKVSLNTTQKFVSLTEIEI